MKRQPDTNSLGSDAADRLAAIADPLRLRLARLVEQRELSVGELAKVVQTPQSTVSRHLKALTDAGWLARRTEGTATLYQLLLDELPAVARGVWLAVREHSTPGAVAEQDDRRLEAVLAERRTDSRSFFGRIGGEWDELRRELFGESFTPDAMLALLDPAWTVADLGCGTGDAAERLAPFVRRVIAVDQSDAMLEAAKRRLARFPNIEFLTGDLERLPLADASIDAAVTVLVLHHIADLRAALAEIHRVLKPGGVALIVDMASHLHDEYRRTMGHKHLGFAPNALESLFADAGFADIRTGPLPSDPDARGPGLIAASARRPRSNNPSSSDHSPIT